MFTFPKTIILCTLVGKLNKLLEGDQDKNRRIKTIDVLL